MEAHSVIIVNGRLYTVARTVDAPALVDWLIGQDEMLGSDTGRGVYPDQSFIMLRMFKTEQAANEYALSRIRWDKGNPSGAKTTPNPHYKDKDWETTKALFSAIVDNPDKILDAINWFWLAQIKSPSSLQQKRLTLQLDRLAQQGIMLKQADETGPDTYKLNL